MVSQYQSQLRTSNKRVGLPGNARIQAFDNVGVGLDMKAITYSRFSTDRQNESSIADQVSICTAHAAHNGMEIFEYFEDRGQRVNAAILDVKIGSGGRISPVPAIPQSARLK